MLKVMQLNLNHCAAAQQLMWQVATENECDVVLLSDPYICPIGNNNFLSNIDNTVAIVITGKYPIQRIITDNCKGLVAAEISGILYCSCYAPPSMTPEEFSQLLSQLEMLAATTPKVVIAGDFNAWSASRGSDMTKSGYPQKRRGEELLSTNHISP